MIVKPLRPGLAARLCAPAAALMFGALAAPAGAQSAASSEPPKLVVLLVVDQMRADYLDRFGSEWRYGLRRLLDEGAVFRHAKYPYFGTLTCAGHATIATGALPSVHGMMLDGWWDPVADRRIGCTVDASAAKIRYGDPRPSMAGARADADSAASLLVPTLADELRAQLPFGSRVAAFSLKARSAITLAGRRADAIAWFDDGYQWTSSTAFSNEPVAWLDRFVRERPVEGYEGRVWTGGTDGAGGFRHELMPEVEGRPDRQFYAAWARSPFADEYLVEKAITAVDALELGQGTRIDYLAIGFSAPDYAGHDFGPDSAEVPDVFRRLDVSIGRLLDHLDRTAGRDAYVVALSADHGVAPIPEEIARQGIDAGRIVRAQMVERVNAALEPHLGSGRHVLAMVHTDLHLAPGVYDRLLADADAMDAALEAIRSAAGVARVFRREELSGDVNLRDPLTRSVAASWFAGRSSDLVIIPRPYWYTWDRGADHGTGYDYDTRVPVVLMGRGIRAGWHAARVTPADIAPTLAFLTGVTLAHAQGRVLTEALAAPQPRTDDEGR